MKYLSNPIITKLNIAQNEQFNIQECISQRKSTETAIISYVFTFEHLIAYTIAFNCCDLKWIKEKK